MEKMRGNGYKLFLETIWLDTRGKNFRMAIAYVTLSHTHIILHDRIRLFSFCLPLAILRSLNLFNRPLRNDWHLSGMIKRILLYCNFTCNICFLPSWFFEHCISTVKTQFFSWTLTKAEESRKIVSWFFPGFASSTKLKHPHVIFQILQNWWHVQFVTKVVTTAAANRNYCLGRLWHIMCA